MKKLVFALALSMCAVPVCAQSMSDPLSKGTKMFFASVKNNILKSAQEMPEENYSFKPTPDVRSFGQIIGHIADAQYEFCGPVLGDTTKPPEIEKTKTSKADLIQGLNDAFAYCDKAYDGMTDAKATEMASWFGRKMPKLVVLEINIAHTDEHYGNLVTYLRMKGLVPPSSQGR
jgi:uncharacterized damage-inducible protein DinB